MAKMVKFHAVFYHNFFKLKDSFNTVRTCKIHFKIAMRTIRYCGIGHLKMRVGALAR